MGKGGAQSAYFFFSGNEIIKSQHGEQYPGGGERIDYVKQKMKAVHAPGGKGRGHERQEKNEQRAMNRLQP